jgi:hypothetical protein
VSNRPARISPNAARVKAVTICSGRASQLFWHITRKDCGMHTRLVRAIVCSIVIIILIIIITMSILLLDFAAPRASRSSKQPYTP